MVNHRPNYKKLNLHLMKKQYNSPDMTLLEISKFHKCGITTILRRADEYGWGEKGDSRKHSEEVKDKCLDLLDIHTFTEVERRTGISRPTLIKWYEDTVY